MIKHNSDIFVTPFLPFSLCGLRCRHYFHGHFKKTGSFNVTKIMEPDKVTTEASSNYRPNIRTSYISRFHSFIYEITAILLTVLAAKYHETTFQRKRTHYPRWHLLIQTATSIQCHMQLFIQTSFFL